MANLLSLCCALQCPISLQEIYLSNSLTAGQYSDAAAAMLDALQMAGREGWQPQSGGPLLFAEEPVQPHGVQQRQQQICL